MATVFESKGVRFVIYTKDHPPPHCHVIHNDWSFKLDITNDFEPYDYEGSYSSRDIKEAQRIARENMYEIGKTWRKYHDT